MLTDSEVIRLYTQEKLSTPVIGRMFGLSHTAVQRRLKKSGVKLRTREETKLPRRIDRDLVRHLYLQDGFSLEQVAKQAGCTFQTVAKILAKEGISRRSAYRTNHCEITEDLINILDGFLLGDGSLRAGRSCKSASFYVSQCGRRKEWLTNSKALLESKGIMSKIDRRDNKDSVLMVGRQKGSLIRGGPHFVLRTSFYTEMLEEYQRWYPNGSKTVPKDLQLAPIGLAQWYFGDGALCRPNGNSQVVFATNGFSYEDADFLAQLIRLTFGWNAHVNKGPVIRMGRRNQILELIQVVAPFAPKCFSYKLRVLNQRLVDP